MNWNKLKEDFNDEINDAMKYNAMSKEAGGCDRQVLKDMAWDEYSHAKQIHRILHEHGENVDGHRDVLHRTKEILEED